jgi:BASS family bile acid:Na+ symporter
VEDFPTHINLLMYAFVVIYMLSVPLETTRGEIITTLGELNLMGRALLANFVLIPILGFGIAEFFNLPPDIKIGFILLSFAPGGLLALQFARVSKGNRVFAVALLFVFCLLAILITPAIAVWLFPREGTVTSAFTWLVMMMFLLILLPAVVGRLLQTLIPRQAPKLGLWLGRLSIVVFIIAAILAGKYKSPAIKLMGTYGIEAIVVLIVSAWVVGWLLGGPEIENRKVLAISSSMRNVGVSLPIASNYFAGSDVAIPMLAFSGLMIPMNMVFALALGWATRARRAGTRPIKA